MSSTLAVSLHASTSETTSGTSANVDLLQRTALELVLNVTATAGTAPTLDLLVETSADGSTGWREAGRFDRASDVGPLAQVIASCSRWVRLKWTIGGSAGPGFTFSVAGDAVIVYATPADIAVHGISAAALENVTIEAQHRSLRASTDRINRALLAAGYILPLLSWGDDIRRDCCAISAYDILTTRGVDPDTIDTWIRLRYLELVGEPGRKGELDKIAEGKLKPPDIVDSTSGPPATGAFGAAVVSLPRRGW